MTSSIYFRWKLEYSVRRTWLDEMKLIRTRKSNTVLLIVRALHTKANWRSVINLKRVMSLSDAHDEFLVQFVHACTTLINLNCTLIQVDTKPKKSLTAENSKLTHFSITSLSSAAEDQCQRYRNTNFRKILKS